MSAFQNIVRALVIAVVNPNYNGRKVYGMFYVKEQIGALLKVSLFGIWIDPMTNGAKSIHHTIKSRSCIYPTSLYSSTA